MNQNRRCRDAIESGDATRLFCWWLMAIQAYEFDNAPFLSDEVFDRLAQCLEDNFDDLRDWEQATLVRGALKGRLGLIGEVPLWAKQDLLRLRGNPDAALFKQGYVVEV